MLKYSTYRSIYENAPETGSAGRRSINGHTTAAGVNMGRPIKSLHKFISQGSLMQLMLVVMLMISGLTVVTQVFAGSADSSVQEKRVIVEPGDTLWEIALRHKPSDMRTAVYIEGIRQHSHLNGNEIQAGDVLTIPLY